MVDVLVEGSEGLDEDIGFLLNEDMILLTFPLGQTVKQVPVQVRVSVGVGVGNAGG